eukprot:4112945-Amphidinium_carterae.1
MLDRRITYACETSRPPTELRHIALVLRRCVILRLHTQQARIRLTVVDKTILLLGVCKELVDAAQTDVDMLREEFYRLKGRVDALELSQGTACLASRAREWKQVMQWIPSMSSRILAFEGQVIGVSVEQQQVVPAQPVTKEETTAAASVAATVKAGRAKKPDLRMRV